MEKWNDTKFEKAFKKDKRKALKTVYTNNKLLIKGQVVNIPTTLVINIDQFKKDSKELHINSYKETKIIFMREPSDKSAYYLAESKYNVCILNFCDCIDAGGLYMSGFETQEEELCRTVPALYDSLKQTKAYPFNCYDTVLYTPNLLLYR